MRFHSRSLNVPGCLREKHEMKVDSQIWPFLSPPEFICWENRYTCFWNGSHAIPLQRAFLPKLLYNRNVSLAIYITDGMENRKKLKKGPGRNQVCSVVTLVTCQNWMVLNESSSSTFIGQDLNLLGPTRENLVFSTLAVLRLDNWLCMIAILKVLNMEKCTLIFHFYSI